MRMQDEIQLIQRARQGDLAAVSELYNLHVDRIYQYVRYRTGDDQTAEDITAEVFLRAIESLGSYHDQGAPFIAWLYRIAHARVIDYWRSLKRRQTAPLDDPLLQDGLVVTDDAIDTDFLQHRSLWLALRQLNGRSAECDYPEVRAGAGQRRDCTAAGKDRRRGQGFAAARAGGFGAAAGSIARTVVAVKRSKE